MLKRCLYAIQYCDERETESNGERDHDKKENLRNLRVKANWKINRQSLFEICEPFGGHRKRCDNTLTSVQQAMFHMLVAINSHAQSIFWGQNKKLTYILFKENVGGLRKKLKMPIDIIWPLCHTQQAFMGLVSACEIEPYCLRNQNKTIFRLGVWKLI